MKFIPHYFVMARTPDADYWLFKQTGRAPCWVRSKDECRPVPEPVAMGWLADEGLEYLHDARIFRVLWGEEIVR